MQADEFEKKIKDKMEGFELVPDNEVWSGVSARIDREKKKRRVLLYWFICGFALLSGSLGLFFINNGTNKKLTENETKGNRKIDNYEIRQKTGDRLKRLHKVPKTMATGLTRDVKSNKPQHFLAAKTNSNTNLSNYNLRRNNTKVTHRQTLVASEEVAGLVSKEEKYEQKSLPSHKFYNPWLKPKSVDSSEKRFASGKANTGIDTLRNAMVQTELDKSMKANKEWSLGFTVYSGISNNLTGLPSLEKNNYSESLNLPGSNVNSSYYLNAGALINFKSSFSIGLGVFIKKQLAETILLSVGIDYHLYSTQSVVGSKVDQQRTFYDSALDKATSVNGYYVAGNSTNYLNKYHLLEVPINLEYQVNKNPHKTVTISAGISPGYMFSSNGLYANPGLNGYYVDKQMYNHFQVSVQSAISVPIINSFGYSLSAGPLIQYGITSAAKTFNNSSQHLFFAGVKANINLK